TPAPQSPAPVPTSAGPSPTHREPFRDPTDGGPVPTPRAILDRGPERQRGASLRPRSGTSSRSLCGKRTQETATRLLVQAWRGTTRAVNAGSGSFQRSGPEG